MGNVESSAELQFQGRGKHEGNTFVKGCIWRDCPRTLLPAMGILQCTVREFLTGEVSWIHGHSNNDIEQFADTQPGTSGKSCTAQRSLVLGVLAY